MPAVEDLAVAFHAYITHRDQQRLQSPIVCLHPDLPAHAPTREQLLRYLSIASAAYSADEVSLNCNLQCLKAQFANFDPSPPIVHRLRSAKWHPGYFLVYDKASQTLILSIRGSCQMADYITDLSLDTVPFLNGRAHKGIAQSAINLQTALRPHLIDELERRNPPGGLVVTGHSLGGGAGAALVLLLRRQQSQPGDSIVASYHFRRARCFSFGPPPFADVSFALTTRQHSGIVTVINGFDLVPRLSINSVDRLLDNMATFDYSPLLTNYAKQATASFARIFVDERNANTLATRVSQAAGKTDARVIAQVPRAISHAARLAVRNNSNSSGRSPWSMLAHATHFLSEIVADKVEGHVERIRSVQEEQVHRQPTERIKGSENNSTLTGQSDRGEHHEHGEYQLVGEIWHLDRKFSLPEGGTDIRAATLPPSVLVKRQGSYFRDIDMCTWMKYDHSGPNIMLALSSLQE